MPQHQTAVQLSDGADGPSAARSPRFAPSPVPAPGRGPGCGRGRSAASSGAAAAAEVGADAGPSAALRARQLHGLRILVHAVRQILVVQVRSGGEPAHADVADDLALAARGSPTRSCGAKRDRWPYSVETWLLCASISALP